MISRRTLDSVWSPRMCRALMRVSPALIMVANCRQKTETSVSLTLFPSPGMVSSFFMAPPPERSMATGT